MLKFQRLVRSFLFRYLTVLTALLLLVLILLDQWENDTSVLITVLGVFSGVFPLLMVGWPAYHLGRKRFEKKSDSFRVGRGWAYGLIALPLLPLVMFPPAGLAVGGILCWQSGKLIAMIRAQRTHQERIPGALWVLGGLFGLDIILFGAGMALIWTVIFAI